MDYVFPGLDGGDDFYLNTKDVDYHFIWEQLGLNPDEVKAADRAVDLLHSEGNSGKILMVTSLSWMKPYNRRMRREAGYQYRTRRELERASRKVSLVRKLFEAGIFEPHPHWPRSHRHHPQTPLKLNPSTLLDYHLEAEGIDVDTYC